MLWQVADLLARTVALREALEDGHVAYAASIVERIELDLVALRDRFEKKAA